MSKDKKPLELDEIKANSDLQQHAAASHLPECESCNITARGMADKVPELIKEIERLRDAGKLVCDLIVCGAFPVDELMKRIDALRALIPEQP